LAQTTKTEGLITSFTAGLRVTKETQATKNAGFFGEDPEPRSAQSSSLEDEA
jgi:hypothetical protein